MQLRKTPNEKGQGMVEFALALCFALALVVGILEIGRLMFVYAAAYAASHEATRFAAGAEVGPSGLPRYTDCEAIRQEAAKLGFVLADAEHIEIRYDSGPNDTRTWDELPACPYEARHGDRVIVRVQTQFSSPFFPGGLLKAVPISADSARTLVRQVKLQ